ncbi:ring-cleaving dioxygenase [Salinadaptatus halalkaliphilus]|uniref:Ring-cleaving dioxygenase n=1 Tax=Salinadaptatus halalkaliphilus TaxID=2419781 RepID=A0A4S3TSI0_9EURY|nr:VOC family protein [Salinadaptatus halalkaliphilus]THE66670.1 ring-cleaving dioxygenase [Salinadaptatus halalkaliphilus]
MPTDPRGIHHVTGLVGDPQQTVDVYAGILGLHLGTVTVNFEDILQYHLYVGDTRGTPGSVFTAFPDPHAQPGRIGSPQPAAVAFAVPDRSLEYWRDRLEEHDIAVEGPVTRFDDRLLRFEDPVGTRLELVARSPDTIDSAIEPPSSGPVPIEHAIRGLDGVSILPVDPYATARTLELFGLEYDDERVGRVRYRTPGTQATIVDVLDLEAEFGREGPGTIHHVALRVSDEAALVEWRERLDDRGYDVSRVKDRHFFHSLYVREPGGILLELATETDGVAVRDPESTEDPSIYLPDWFEPDRELIESQLPALRRPTDRHESPASSRGGADP